MSRLRARCPDCRTYTAVALGPDYECHACGRTFGAGLVRVPRAWGKGGEAMSEAERHGLWLYESKGRCWRCHKLHQGHASARAANLVRRALRST